MNQCLELNARIVEDGLLSNKNIMTLYRYHEVALGDIVYLHVESHLVIRETRCFWFIQDRRVMKKARKQFACQTKEKALLSFFKRKKRQLKILSSQMKRCESAILLARQEELSFQEFERQINKKPIGMDIF